MRILRSTAFHCLALRLSALLPAAGCRVRGEQPSRSLEYAAALGIFLWPCEFGKSRSPHGASGSPGVDHPDSPSGGCGLKAPRSPSRADARSEALHMRAEGRNSVSTKRSFNSRPDRPSACAVSGEGGAARAGNARGASAANAYPRVRAEVSDARGSAFTQPFARGSNLPARLAVQRDTERDFVIQTSCSSRDDRHHLRSSFASSVDGAKQCPEGCSTHRNLISGELAAIVRSPAPASPAPQIVGAAYERRPVPERWRTLIGSAQLWP